MLARGEGQCCGRGEHRRVKETGVEDGDWTREQGSDAERGGATRLWGGDHVGSGVPLARVAFGADQPPPGPPLLLLLLLLMALEWRKGGLGEVGQVRWGEGGRQRREEGQGGDGAHLGWGGAPCWGLLLWRAMLWLMDWLMQDAANDLEKAEEDRTGEEQGGLRGEEGGGTLANKGEAGVKAEGGGGEPRRVLELRECSGEVAAADEEGDPRPGGAWGPLAGEGARPLRVALKAEGSSVGSLSLNQVDEEASKDGGRLGAELLKRGGWRVHLGAAAWGNQVPSKELFYKTAHVEFILSCWSLLQQLKMNQEGISSSAPLNK